ncbi:hypothetical protein T492DRAFT_102621 [Pavlovales sp. CCMP2436]|nr:hypothetical protein T492DRAFT_102621 [Pavlovales sp. CCMP2436]
MATRLTRTRERPSVPGRIMRRTRRQSSTTGTLRSRSRRSMQRSRTRARTWTRARTRVRPSAAAARGAWCSLAFTLGLGTVARSASRCTINGYSASTRKTTIYPVQLSHPRHHATHGAKSSIRQTRNVSLRHTACQIRQRQPVPLHRGSGASPNGGGGVDVNNI